jgi:hypothetical protein
MTSKYVCYRNYGIYDVFARNMIGIGNISYQIANQIDSTWMNCIEVVSINDEGEAIAQGKTIYGEKHAMLLIPIKSK